MPRAPGWSAVEAEASTGQGDFPGAEPTHTRHWGGTKGLIACPRQGPRHKIRPLTEGEDLPRERAPLASDPLWPVKVG